jgi:hypothetical protein
MARASLTSARLAEYGAIERIASKKAIVQSRVTSIRTTMAFEISKAA